MVEKKSPKKKVDKKILEEVPTLAIATEREIVLDFGTKVYEEFQNMVKAIILFGSSAKKTAQLDSDIDVIILIDDVSLKWDAELIATYREELAKIIQLNPYKKALHVNTVKLSTWWADLTKGDPIILNVLRYGEAIIDHGGFFEPLKLLLKEGQIHSTPEAIYTLLQRAPTHLKRARDAIFASIDGLYWCCVDAAHAALIAAKIRPPSPEHIQELLSETFVKKGKLSKKQVQFYNEIHSLAKEIVHGNVKQIKICKLDDYFKKTDEFLREMAKLVENLI